MTPTTWCTVLSVRWASRRPPLPRCRLALAELQLVSGHPQAAVHEAQSVALDPTVPEALHALAEVWLLWATLALDNPEAAPRQVEVILSGGLGSDEFLPAALTALGIVTWRDGRVADALALIRAAVAQFDRQATVQTRPIPPTRLALASMLTALGDLDEAAELVDATNDEMATGADRLWSAAPRSLRRGSAWRPEGSTRRRRRRTPPSSWPRSRVRPPS